MEVKYQAGYAKSGRSSCHLCKRPLPLFQLRLGKKTPSKFFDGYQLVWYHPTCLIKRDKNLIQSSDNIDGFESLKLEDQQRVRNALGEKAGEQDAQSIENSKVFWQVKGKLQACTPVELRAMLELNGCPSTGGQPRLVFKCADGIVFGVPTCPQCNTVGQLNYAKGQYKCEALLEWGKCGYTGDVTKIADWKFPPNSPVPSNWARRERSKNAAGASEQADGEENENQEDEGEEGEDEGNDGENHQEDNEDEEEAEDEDDEEEEEDDEGEEEEEEAEEAEREEIKPALFSFGQPLFGQPQTSSAFGSPFAQPLPFGTSFGASPTKAKGLSMEGITFAQAGRLTSSKNKLQNFISSNGGNYSSAINKRVNFVVSTAAEVARNRRRIRKAKEEGIPVVVELFLHRIADSGGVAFDHLPYTLIEQSPNAGFGVRTKKAAKISHVREKKPLKAKATKKATKKAPKLKAVPKVKAGPIAKAPKPIFAKPAKIAFPAVAKPPSEDKAKTLPAPSARPTFMAPTPSPVLVAATAATKPGGGPVDPEAKCPPGSMIYSNDGDVYNVMLNQTDINEGLNKFYKLQLIDTGDSKNFVVFAKWGRVGTDIGMSSKKAFNGRTSAIAEFAAKYRDKTGNEWVNRSNFAKKPGKYVPVDVELEEPEPTIANPVPKPASKVVGPPVDTNSGKSETAHVLNESGAFYNAMLNQTNIGANNNKFYVIQVLESNENNKYWTWNRWGRVGEKGQSKLEDHGSNKRNAISSFQKKFTDKTKNSWEDRDNFRPAAGKYTLMKMEYEPAPELSISETPTSSSFTCSLDPAVQSLVDMIFDVKMMNQTLSDLNIDVKKMPLGNISKNQILKGYDVLTKIDTALKQPDANKGDFIMWSNMFYTLIPHDFGRKTPDIINNTPLLKSKMKQLETLIELQVASTLLKEAAAAGIHPTDAKYKKLNTGITTLSKFSSEFEIIKRYLQNTIEEADSPYRLELEDVFVIDRDGEAQRYEPFQHLERKLLWHGSRLSNWISQGLRIAPPEAPKTGYMFGKGVYFGDMVAKSAEYCFTTPTSNTGLLLLSKVALGKSYEKSPESYQSTHAIAKLKPDPSDYTTMGDVHVPYGRGVPSNIPDAFLSHGEYVVYNVGQINMKYLLRVKFHHK